MVVSQCLHKYVSQPLLAIKRDRTGPAGESQGTVTHDPDEIDDVPRRAWGGIYEGNQKDLFKSAELFRIIK